MRESPPVGCFLAGSWPDERAVRTGCWHWSHPGHRQTLPVRSWMCWEVDSHLASPAGTHGLTGPNYTEHYSPAYTYKLPEHEVSSSHCLICPVNTPKPQLFFVFLSFVTWLVQYASIKTTVNSLTGLRKSVKICFLCFLIIHNQYIFVITQNVQSTWFISLKHPLSIHI